VTSGLVLSAGCGGSGEPAAATPSPSVTPSSSPSSSPRPAATPAPVALAPLTGLPSSPGLAGRPAMGVIIGLYGGVPPVGLSDADLVYTEYAEGGLLRLIAVFQSRDSASVGPVTTTRPADPRVLEVFKGCVGYAGGSTGMVKQLTASGVCGIIAGQFTSTAALYARVTKGRTAPPPAFVYAAPGQPLGSVSVTPARTLVVTPPGRAPQTWTYDPTARLWRSTVSGAPVSAASIEVLTMAYRGIVVHSPLRTLYGANVYGQGAATVVSGGHAVHGSWYRPSAKTLVNIVDQAKQIVHPAPGRAWVLFAPTGSTVVVH